MPKKKPNSTEFISNPITKRPIKVGGRVYLRLQKQGYFQEGYLDDQILEEFGGETENMKLMKDKIEEFNQELPENQQAVKGRGRYKNKIVKRYRKLPKKAPQKPVISESSEQARIIMALLRSLPEGDMETQLADLLSGKMPQAQPQQVEEYEDPTDTEIDYSDYEDSDDEY